MRLPTILVLLTLFTFLAGSALAQPRAYIPSLFENTVTVLDVSTNSVIDVIDVGNRAFSAAVTPDGTKVYVAINPETGMGPGRVDVIQTSTNTVIATIEVGGSPSDVAITPDGTRAYVSNGNGNVNIINTATDAQILPNIAIPGLNPRANFISITPNGLFAYVLITGTSQRLVTIDTTTNMVLPAFTRSGLGEGVGMDITPDGTKLYIPFRNSAIGDPDFVQLVDLNTMTGEPTIGMTFPLVFSGTGTVDCELRPEFIAIHPTTGLPWILTDPRPFSMFATCPPSSPFHADLVIIDPSAMTPTLLISGLPTPPWPFLRLAFTRDGSDAVLIEGSRIRTSPASLPLMLSMQTTIDASFPESPYFIGPDMNQLTVTKTGNGNGNVTSTNPAGMNCDSSMNEICDIAVPTDMEVTLTATADGSSIFNGWGGDCSGAGTSTMITVNADSNCTADFEIQQFNVDVSINPPGGGSVTSSPSGIDCPGDCSELFDINTFINLTETADPDFNFVNWTGAADCTDGDIDDLTEDTSCTANFAIKRFTVTVNIEGDGVGSVSSTPPGINCPGDCSEEYDIHTAVTLNETTDPDSDFLGWTGPADCADGIIQDLTQDITCTATFNLKRFTLNITKSGEGDGTVTSVPAGIDCGADCDEVFIINTQVTLSAVADPVSIFTGFSGHPDCEDGVVDMLSDITCNANFDFLPLLLSPIFPGIKNNVNTMSTGNSTPGGQVAFVWGFQTGSFTVGGAVCAGTELGINPLQLLGIVNADGSGVAELIFFVPSLGNIAQVFTQAVDIGTCRTSEVVQNTLGSN